MFNEITGRIEQQLASTSYLVGDRITAADVTAMRLVALALMPESAAQGPNTGFFQQHFELGDGRNRTREWVRRVKEYDPAAS